LAIGNWQLAQLKQMQESGFWLLALNSAWMDPGWAKGKESKEQLAIGN